MMDKDITFRKWTVLAGLSGFKVGRYSRPNYVGSVPTPSNLNDLTIGQLIDLSKVEDSNESLYNVVSTVLGMTRDEISRSRAIDVVRFVGWVSGEVERINKLFEGADNIKPTRQERQAGVDTLKFGLFGMLDWYAVRMGIQDHDEVLKTPWLRIYKCMDMDNKKRAYEIRLRNIQTQEIKKSK